ncbi:MAG: OmpH family outer membrane protein [Phycisphaerae bacterium]|nr:OmpH family outer membrane protein [Phycisphaerae bacterium]
MNGKTVTASILVCVAALWAAMQYGHAASQPATPVSKIGLVSVRDVFGGSKKHALYQDQTAKRVAQARIKIDDLTKQLDTEEGDLKTLKQGTAEYVKQFQVVLDTRSKLQNRQELFKQQRMAEDKKWFEDLYQETLKATEAAAKERGLDLVLERTEPKFPIASEEVWSTVSTNKVLYGGGCPDLTNDVIARIDASATLKP